MILDQGGNLVFLIGPPRSGTTLLSLVLSNAPELYCPPERWVALAIESLVREAPLRGAPNSDDRLVQLALNQALSPEQRIGFARDVLHRLYSWWHAQDGRASILVDKTPRYYRIIEFLARVFPDARFLLMARNPLDVAGSHKHRWGFDIAALATASDGEVLDPAMADILFSHRFIADARDRLGEQSHFIRYEDLVVAPSAVVAGCFAFLGVPYDDTMLAIDSDSARHAEHRRSSLGDSEVWRRDTIDATSVGTYTQRLSKTEIDRVASLVGISTFERLGYQPPPVADDPTRRGQLWALFTGDATGDARCDPRPGHDAHPCISIVTPSLNQGRWIEQTILSVLGQDYPNFEHIIIDGGSDDETLNIVRRYRHVRLVAEPDRGQTHAINKGLLLARGDILAYLNSDDVYYPGTFQHVAKQLSPPDAAPVLVGACDRLDESGEVIGHYIARGARFERLQRYWEWDGSYCLPQQSTFWRRELMAHVGLFDTECKYSMDYDMWMRMLLHYQVQTTTKTLAGFRFHAQSKTVAQTDGMYAEQLAVARRYWPGWRSPTRWRLEAKGRRVCGQGLLDVAEHVALSDDPRSPFRILARAIKHHPGVALSPRAILTVITSSCERSKLAEAAETAHRAYLHTRWRTSRLLRSVRPTR